MKELLDRGHTPVAVTRNAPKARQIFGDRIEIVEWDGQSAATLAGKLAGIDVIVNLAGENIAAGRWTKKRIKEFLWQNSKFPWSVVTSDSEVFRRAKDVMKQYVPPGEPWPIAVKPDNLMIVVAGGKQSGHGYWMRLGCCTTQPISMQIELPKNWEALITRAEEDMGPPPTI